MLIIALVAFLALFVAWFLLPGGKASSVQLEAPEPRQRLTSAEA